jgi:cholinesterase
MKSTSLFSAAASFVLAASPAVAWTVGQGVDTSSGTVIGHAASLDSSVSEYLGIPWAAPPVGALRWQPPQPFPKSATPLKADVFSPDCVQSRGSGGSRNLTGIQAGVLANLSGGKSISEDCLTLNIWTKPQSGEKKKAVLVWVYGGGFSTGSTASSSYNGVKFAGNQDVVLVSINYRLMIMGFPAAPALFDNVNLGLIDQRSALFWIKNNIAAFGGDPDRITLFGESAGGRSVDIYAYAWANETDPIVNGFIAQSGAAPQNTGWTPRPNSWFELARRSGCGAAKGKESVECMRTKSVDVIMQALGTDGGKRADLMRAFTPVTDGKTYFSDYDKRAEAGQFIKKVYGPDCRLLYLANFLHSRYSLVIMIMKRVSLLLSCHCKAKP